MEERGRKTQGFDDEGNRRIRQSVTTGNDIIEDYPALRGMIRTSLWKPTGKAEQIIEVFERKSCKKIYKPSLRKRCLKNMQ